MAWLEMNNIICLTSYHHFSHAEHKRFHSVAFIIVARSLWPNMGYVEQPGKCKLVQLSERDSIALSAITSQEREKERARSHQHL